MSNQIEGAWLRACDAVNAVITYLQQIRIAEIRQTCELVGVHHIEVVVALLLFVMLQFTKFTGVLLIACGLAYAIFYMWDTWFPELREGGAIRDKQDYGNNPPGVTPYFDLSDSTTNVTEYARNAPLLINYSFRDARTSATLPPYSDSFNGNSMQEIREMEERRLQIRDYINSSAENQPIAGRSSIHRTSGNATPVAPGGSFIESRSPRRPFYDEYKPSRRHEREPQSAKRMQSHDYRLYRTNASTDPNQLYRYSIPDDHRHRRYPMTLDDVKSQKVRRYADPKYSRKYYGIDPSERIRNDSPDNSRRPRNNPGTSNRSNINHSPVNLPPNLDNKSTRRNERFADYIQEMKNKPLINMESNINQMQSAKSNESYPYVVEMVKDYSDIKVNQSNFDRAGNDVKNAKGESTEIKNWNTETANQAENEQEDCNRDNECQSTSSVVEIYPNVVEFSQYQMQTRANKFSRENSD